jgi:hypothetical protein
MLTILQLHGLPISVKDNFKVKGYDATVGFPAWANQPMSDDSELIRILREAGAVLYCKTNSTFGLVLPCHPLPLAYSQPGHDDRVSSHVSTAGDDQLTPDQRELQ